MQKYPSKNLLKARNYIRLFQEFILKRGAVGLCTLCALIQGWRVKYQNFDTCPENAGRAEYGETKVLGKVNMAKLEETNHSQ